MNTHASYEIFGTHRAVQYRQNTNIDDFNFVKGKVEKIRIIPHSKSSQASN